MLKIRIEGDSILVKPSIKIAQVDKNIRKLVLQMKFYLTKTRNLGLSAVQVGFPKRIFVINTFPQIVAINPSIMDIGSATTEEEETCLSCPGKCIKVRRTSIIQLTALNEYGERFTVRLSDLVSRVAQHEYDHLEGILITSKGGEPK